MKFLDRYDAINPLSLSDSVNLIAPFAQGEILRPEHIVEIRNLKLHVSSCDSKQVNTEQITVSAATHNGTSLIICVTC